MAEPKKSLGQHWLQDRVILSSIADAAKLDPNDTILEIGPGQGGLTSELLRRSKRVVAVEFDEDLAAKLPGQFPGKSLDVVNGDVLSFDLDSLPPGYKVVANVPYYITSKIVQMLMTANNKPAMTVLLVQKEVAERLAATPGDMSILGISAQLYAEVTLGDLVPAKFFTPPPKVDSQVIILKTRLHPLIAIEKEKEFFRVVKAGFSARRKKLRTSLAGGLGLSKEKVGEVLSGAKISGDQRAQDLSVVEWMKLREEVYDTK